MSHNWFLMQVCLPPVAVFCECVGRGTAAAFRKIMGSLVGLEGVVKAEVF